MYDGIGLHTLTFSAWLASVTFLVFFPIMLLMSAVRANGSFTVSKFLEFIPAIGFVRIL
jgi:hypothetical protein